MLETTAAFQCACGRVTPVRVRYIAGSRLPVFPRSIRYGQRRSVSVCIKCLARLDAQWWQHELRRRTTSGAKGG